MYTWRNDSGTFARVLSPLWIYGESQLGIPHAVISERGNACACSHEVPVIVIRLLPKLEC